MEREITAFSQDDAGAWVAHLSCFHRQHIRHNPPFRLAPWVLDEAERAARVGAPLDCPLCDRAELPEGLEVVPAANPPPPGAWRRVRVQAGRVRVRADTRPPIDVVVEAGGAQAIPPETDHSVEPDGPTRMCVELLGPQA